jgi:transcriptional regulator with XRE-family HTH domain
MDYYIQELSSDKKNITYDDLLETLQEVEKEKYFIENSALEKLEIEYNTHYTYKQLQKIAEYYDISISLTKQQLIQEITMFEKNTENIEKVYQRKKLWKYIEEIKNDTYLSKFLYFS